MIIATDADGVSIIDATGLHKLAEAVLDASGRLTVQPASFYAQTRPEQRAMLCVQHGAYCLPTFELVTFLKELIGNRYAIEIGSGNGVLAEALGIRATDNHMQEWPEIKQVYESMQQALVPYGANVERIDGMEAAAKYKPQVIVGAWLTHKRRESALDRGGNHWAPDELALLDLCDELILVGNSSTHKDNPLLSVPHMYYELPFLYSRALKGRDFVGCWSKR